MIQWRITKTDEGGLQSSNFAYATKNYREDTALPPSPDEPLTRTSSNYSAHGVLHKAF